MNKQPIINDLAIIGDRRSCAIVDKEGTVCWYCPDRFDKPSVFSLLIDKAGGYWSVSCKNKKFLERNYDGYSGILTTTFMVNSEVYKLTDWMDMQNIFPGICRKFVACSVAIENRLMLKPGYGEDELNLELVAGKNRIIINKTLHLNCSHPLKINNRIIAFTIPPNKEGWAALTNASKMLMNAQVINESLQKTKKQWTKIMSALTYQGVYKKQMYQSFLAIQLMTHFESGGIIAAATTSLPEVIGGKRNYDYRYVWLRDTAMNVSALIRAESKGKEAENFLGFLCDTRTKRDQNRFIPMYTIDGQTAPNETTLKAGGYQHSKPVVEGNGANEQLQLDANGNVLLAAKQVYNKNKKKPHWKTVVTIANYLGKNWKKKDHGIWEENVKAHFTSSKVIVAKSLEFIAEYADDAKQKQEWLMAAQEIKKFIAEKCITSDGAYAVYAGSEDVDITAALFPVWWFVKPDEDVMVKTIERLEKEYGEGDLYHRHLEEFDAMQEGVFLAGSLWMAQYYIELKALSKAKTIIDGALKFSTDLGFMAEEGDIKTGKMLGNFPQTFVHASLMGVIIDYNNALLNLKDK